MKLLVWLQSGLAEQEGKGSRAQGWGVEAAGHTWDHGLASEDHWQKEILQTERPSQQKQGRCRKCHRPRFILLMSPTFSKTTKYTRKRTIFLFLLQQKGRAHRDLDPYKMVSSGDDPPPSQSSSPTFRFDPAPHAPPSTFSNRNTPFQKIPFTGGVFSRVVFTLCS